MKTTTIPSIGVEPDFRAEVKAVLAEGETLSQFVEASVRTRIKRRRMQAEFIARGLLSRDAAGQTGDYVGADEVIDGLRGVGRLRSVKTTVGKDVGASIAAGLPSARSACGRRRPVDTRVGVKGVKTSGWIHGLRTLFGDAIAGSTGQRTAVEAQAETAAGPPGTPA